MNNNQIFQESIIPNHHVYRLNNLKQNNFYTQGNKQQKIDENNVITIESNHIYSPSKLEDAMIDIDVRESILASAQQASQNNNNNPSSLNSSSTNNNNNNLNNTNTPSTRNNSQSKNPSLRQFQTDSVSETCRTTMHLCDEFNSTTIHRQSDNPNLRQLSNSRKRRLSV